MFSRRKRFSLLQLEDDEDYVSDWVVSTSWPASIPGNSSGRSTGLTGRLRLGSRSLYWEPDDARAPIVKLPFTGLTQLEGEGSTVLALTATTLTTLKAHGQDHPYQVLRATPSSWRFTLTYATLEGVLPLVQQYLAASRLPPADRTSMLLQLARAAEDAAVFDSSRLVDFREGVAWEGPAALVRPLLREPGRLAISSSRVYFQPLHNVTGDAAMRSHPLSAVGAVVRRRSALQPTGLELFFIPPPQGEEDQPSSTSTSSSEGAGASGGAAGGGGAGGPVWGASSAFFSFRSEADRDAARAALLAQPLLGAGLAAAATWGQPAAAAAGGAAGGAPLHALAGQLLEAGGSSSSWLARLTRGWVAGRLTNFDYLLYLNLAAGRTFNDLAQWPVFPWVLADYTSPTLDLSDPQAYRDLTRPMGALNPTRLEDFRRRYQDMSSMAQQDPSGEGGLPPPFMYGTHYSTPGYVLYWLVRAAPAHMLRLQAGRFDAPDRLFHCLADSWHSATSSTTDVKELIPEFYMSNPDFLVNASRLPLGVRQNGSPVGDVVLPPWAQGSPLRFLALHRAALESPAVSAALHRWLDLVFGYQQRGAAAVAADNVFYHLTYEGAVDISKVEDPQELRALQVQVNEFGQTPRQLFTCPHPPRAVLPPTPYPEQLLEQLVEQQRQQQQAGGGGDSGSPGGKAGAGGGSRGTGTTSSTSTSSSSGLVNAGEDGGGGSVALSLLHTLMAALQAGEGEHEEGAGGDGAGSSAQGNIAGQLAAAAAVAAAAAPAATSSSSSSSKAQPIPVPPPQPTPAAAAGGRSVEGGGLSPPEDTDVLSAAPLPLPLPAAPWGGAVAAAAAAAVAGRRGSSSSSTTTTSGGSLLAALSPKGGTQALLGLLQKVQLTSTPSTEGPAPPPAPAAALLPSQQQQSSSTNTGGTQLDASTPATSTTLDHTATVSSSSGSSSSSSWPEGAVSRLLLTQTVKLQHAPLCGLAASAAAGGGGGLAAVVGQEGLLRLVQLPQLKVTRSAQLSEDLLSCCHLAAPQHSTHSTAAAAAGSTWLLGGSRGSGMAYSGGAGRLLGTWAAHEDATSALSCLGPGGATLLTTSWDCSIKTWDLSEGRAPWASTLPLPLATIRDMEAGVWAASAAPSGQLLVYGTEDGTLGAVDLRTACTVWSAAVSDDYIGGVQWLPGGSLIGLAAADGTMSVLDWRSRGQPLAQVQCGQPLRCCTGDARQLLAGSEGGQVQVWDISRLTGVGSSSLQSSMGLEGLCSPLTCGSKAAVNALCMITDARSGTAWLLAAQDDGALAIFST